MTERYDAVVVGGGIVGASTAYHLTRTGVDVLLIDRRDDGRATSAGAGIVSPPTSSRTAADDWFAFATDAAAYYPELTERLERDGAGDTSYRRLGTIAVATDEDELDPFDAALKRIRDREIDRVEEIDPAEAVERFPALAEPKRAFSYPGAARVDGGAFAESLLTAGRARGLEAIDGEVVSLRIEADRVTGVETGDGRRIDADDVVVAGGAWSTAFADQLGVELPVEPKRGQIAHLALPDADTNSWPIVTGFRHHYIVPWPDGRLVLGATREPGVGFDPRLTAEGINEVLSEGLRVAPGLADATIAELRVGLRPVSADGRPILGTVPAVDGAYLATGHGATGLLLGPYSGKIVADCVTGDPTAVPEHLSVTRFDGE